MTNRAKTGIVLSALVMGLAGCSDSGSSSTAPSTRHPAAGWVHPAYSLSNVTLSGVVYEGTPTG